MVKLLTTLLCLVAVGCVDQDDIQREKMKKFAAECHEKGGDVKLIRRFGIAVGMHCKEKIFSKTRRRIFIR